MGLGTSVASADVDYVDVDVEEEEHRTGMTFGVGAGVGHLECAGEYCDGMTEAGGLNIHIGAMVTPRLALMADAWAMAHMEDDLTVSQTMATVGPQLWLLPRLWLRAGIGVSRASYNYDTPIVEFMDSTEWVAAGMAAAGFEILSGSDFVLDLQVRAGSGFFHDADTQIRNLSLGVGASWY